MHLIPSVMHVVLFDAHISDMSAWEFLQTRETNEIFFPSEPKYWSNNPWREMLQRLTLLHGSFLALSCMARMCVMPCSRNWPASLLSRKLPTYSPGSTCKEKATFNKNSILKKLFPPSSIELSISKIGT